MALLPRPYPDELIGSVIARGAWHTGLPLKSMLKSIFGPTTSGNSFLMGTRFSALTQATGLDAEELMLSHTVFPYATAFMPTSAKADLVAKALRPRRGQDCLGSITKNVSHGVRFRRVCPTCVKEELAMFGESYWHRQHLLPGSLVCLTHGKTLAVTDIPVRGRTQTRDALLPHMVLHKRLRARFSVEQLMRLTKISALALNGDISADGLLTQYRSQAVTLGYTLPSGQIASVAFTERLHSFYGKYFLADTGCSMSERSPWPSIMLRPGTQIPFATPKHVLMQAFLEADSGASSSLVSEYKKPGKKTTDFKRLDSKLSIQMKTAIRIAKEESRRMTVKELFTEAGSWGAFRHHREHLPKSTELVLQFRESDLAERQIGGRAYWRKRHPARYPKAL